MRGVAVSSRSPYLFSCGEDKQVKCWDLEYNKVGHDRKKEGLASVYMLLFTNWGGNRQRFRVCYLCSRVYVIKYQYLVSLDLYRSYGLLLDSLDIVDLLLRSSGTTTDILVLLMIWTFIRLLTCW